jgi:ferric-dicitrate binding protein FerR (iron transport regulator)
MDKEYLIQKWLNDELTPEEFEIFRGFDDYQFYVDIVENAKKFKASDVSKVDDFDTFNHKVKTKQSKVVKSLWINPFLRIASVIVVALGLYFSLFYNSMTEVNTLAHQKTTIELPDASKVILNALSEVEFDEKNWDTKRTINLKGEAFFKVRKGKKFDVITSVGVVSVVGTEFSVKQRGSYFEVKCYEGIVTVASNGITETLTAGKTYRMLNGEFSQSNTTFRKPQWLDNISSFETVPFKEVIAELERQYDLKIELQNTSQNPIFTGGFVHDNLDSALMSITQPLNLTYKIVSPKQVVIYGHKK